MHLTQYSFSFYHSRLVVIACVTYTSCKSSCRITTAYNTALQLTLTCRHKNCTRYPLPQHTQKGTFSLILMFDRLVAKPTAGFRNHVAIVLLAILRVLSCLGAFDTQIAIFLLHAESGFSLTIFSHPSHKMLQYKVILFYSSHLQIDFQTMFTYTFNLFVQSNSGLKLRCQSIILQTSNSLNL